MRQKMRKYIPKYFVKQTTMSKDETLEKGFQILEKSIDDINHK